ncbi:MAG: hypothetical protein KF832_25195 [Caldilineaceae bacterium]|nr:hypothetical protein [Caldilineaceae bacterium]
MTIMLLLMGLLGTIGIATLIGYAACRAAGRTDEMEGDHATDGETTL